MNPQEETESGESQYYRGRREYNSPNVTFHTTRIHPQDGDVVFNYGGEPPVFQHTGYIEDKPYRMPIKLGMSLWKRVLKAISRPFVFWWESVTCAAYCTRYQLDGSAFPFLIFLISVPLQIGYLGWLLYLDFFVL